MENKNQYDELLVKYLANEVDTEERKFVEGWIDAGKENHLYFEQLKIGWQLSSVKPTLDYVLDKMNVDEEWDDFKQKVTEKEIGEQALHQGAYIKGERPERKSAVYRFIIQAAIAVSVILVIGAGWNLLVKKEPETRIVQNAGKKNDDLIFDVRHEVHEVNTTGKEKRIQLPDGSLIVLADKSEISYRAPFTGKRDIALIGKAYFKVSKEKTRPFTVASGDVTTTALGTEFTVTAFEKDKTIIVRLYEGKVVVKAGGRMINDIYLVPGQEFIYNRQPATELKEFKLNKAAAPEQILIGERLRDNPAIPQDDEGSWYMFNNQQLGQVLDQFAALYNVKIIYDEKDVRNIYFTGQYNRLEPLETILKRISTLNNLTITKKDNTFIISK